MEEGSLASLTQQNVDGLVNLTVGNLRSGEVVTVRLDLVAGIACNDTGFRLRLPFTVAPCHHPQMRASLESPGVGIVEMPGALPLRFHEDAAKLHQIGFDLSEQRSTI